LKAAQEKASSLPQTATTEKTPEKSTTKKGSEKKDDNAEVNFNNFNLFFYIIISSNLLLRKEVRRKMILRRYTCKFYNQVLNFINIASYTY
jgi:hypothetical protein